MIKDLEIVALTRNLPEYGLLGGDTGTIVHVYEDGRAYEVEFMTMQGRTIAIATVPSDAVRAIGPRDMPRVRAIADAAE